VRAPQNSINFSFILGNEPFWLPIHKKINNFIAPQIEAIYKKKKYQ
jgi:hypothetical protein